MKKTVKTLLVLLMLALLVGMMAACSDAGGNNMLTIVGYQDGDLVIGIGEIRAQFEKNKRELTEVYDPAKYNDATSSDYQKMHTASGVYLDDLLLTYGKTGETCKDFTTITLEALDGYVMILSKQHFEKDLNGSDILITLEYDGKVISEKEGNMRVVLDKQANGYWVKKISKITMSKQAINVPNPNNIHFVEMLLENENLLGSFERERINKETKESMGVYEYKGLSIAKLKQNGILGYQSADTMYLTAWDGETASNFNRHVNWHIYDTYDNCILVETEAKKGEGHTAIGTPPAIDGTVLSEGSGMKVKNVTVLSVGNDTLITLRAMMLRYAGGTNEFAVDYLLDEMIADELNKVNKKDVAGKTITVKNGAESQTITGEVFAAGKIRKTNEGYLFVDVDGNTQAFTSFHIG